MNTDKTAAERTPEQKKADDARVLGAKLREIREAQGLTLDDACDALKIQQKYLSAIESGSLELLPKGPFCRSFLRQYCGYLKADDLWKRYDKLTNKKNEALDAYNKEDEEANYTSNPKIFRKSSYLWVYMVIVLCLGSAAWITWQYRSEIKVGATTPLDGGTAPIVESKQHEQPAPAPAPLSQEASAPAATQPASVDLGWMDGKAPVKAAPPKAPLSSDAAAVTASVDAASVPAPAANVPPAAGNAVLRVAPTVTIWIKATVGGKSKFEGLLKQGETKDFTPDADTPLRVRYGNPAKTNISWMGSAEAPVTRSGSPVTKYYWSDGTVTDTRNR